MLNYYLGKDIDPIMAYGNVVMSHRDDSTDDIISDIFIKSTNSVPIDLSNTDKKHLFIFVSDVYMPDFLSRNVPNDTQILNIVKTDISEKIKISQKKCIVIASPAKVIYFMFKHNFGFDDVRLLVTRDVKTFIMNPCYRHQFEYLLKKLGDKKNIILFGNHISYSIRTFIENNLEIQFKFCRIKKSVSTQKKPEPY